MQNSRLQSLIVFFVQIIKSVFGSSLNFFQGKRMWNIRLPKDITTIEVVDYKPKGFKAVLVALSNNEVHVYKVDYIILLHFSSTG